MKNFLSAAGLAISVLAGFLCAPAAVRADTMIWTGADSDNWNDLRNWNPPQVPGKLDTAFLNPGANVLVNDEEGAVELVITGEPQDGSFLEVSNGGVLSVGDIMVNSDVSLQVAGGKMGAGTVTVNPGSAIGINGGTDTIVELGTATVTGAQFETSSIEVAGGVVAVNSVTINEDAIMAVTGGTLEIGSATVNGLGSLSQAGGLLNISGGTTNESGGDLEITGTFSVVGEIDNSGTINLTDADVLLWNDGVDFFGGINNQGTINLAGVGGDRITVFYGTENFANYSGTINVEEGTGPCLFDCTYQAFQGAFTAAAGTTLQFYGEDPSAPVSGGAYLAGLGQFEWVSGWLVLGSGIPNLALTGGRVAFEDDFRQDSGVTNFILDGSTLIPSSSSPYILGGIVDVTNSVLAAAIEVASGGVVSLTGATLATNGSLAVDPGGVVNITGEFPIYGALTNAGTINLIDSGMILEPGTYAYMTNSGTVNVQSSLGLSTITTDSGFLAGTYNAAAGTTVQFVGGNASDPMVISTAPSLNGPGQYELSGYLVLPNGGIPNLPLSGAIVTLPPGQQSGVITDLALDGGTLAGNYQINGTLAATNTLLTGALAVNPGGVFISAGATLAATGSLTIQPGGVVGIVGVDYGLSGGMFVFGPMTNLGAVNLTNATLTLYNNGSSSANGGIVNQGVINFFGELGDRIFSEDGSEYLLNEGTVNVEPGTGKSTIYVYGDLLSGTYNAAAGTTLQLSGGTVDNPLAAQPSLGLNGPGSYLFTFGYLLLDDKTIPNLALVGGTLELGPAFQGNGTVTNLSISGMILPGNCQISGVLSATNTSFKGLVTISPGAVLNAAGGELAPSAGLAIASGAECNITGSFSIHCPLTNFGALNLSDATLSLFNNQATSSGAIDNEGQINLYGASGDQISSQLGRETLVNAGAITQRPGAGNSSLSVPLFTEPGTVDVEEGALTLNSLPLQPSSALHFGLNSAANYGKIVVLTNVLLAGTVSASFNNGFVPSPGEDFGVLSAGAVAGTFASVGVPDGSDGQGIYGSELFSLSFPGSTPPAQPVLTITRASAGTVTLSWPSAGNFTLQTSPTMAKGTWTGITSGIVIIGQNVTFSAPLSALPAFFRLESR